jgi:hypothetical protein
VNVLQRLALTSYMELLPRADEDRCTCNAEGYKGVKCITHEDEYYHVEGILPMLREWVRGTASFAANEWTLTWGIIFEDHPRLRRLFRQVKR